MSRPRGTERKSSKSPLLPPDVTCVDYKDTTLLRKFISDRGKVRSRRVTGLTVQQQHAVTRAIKNAREMALIPYGNRPADGARASR